MLKAPSTSLQLRFTEPVVFLRNNTPPERGNRRRLTDNPDESSPPAMLRGLMTLKLGKPSKIKSIVCELVGVARTEWPEGIGPRRTQVHEEQELINKSITFFSAKDLDSADRRAASVGQAVRPYWEAGWEEAVSDGDDEEEGGAPAHEPRGRDLYRPAERTPAEPSPAYTATPTASPRPHHVLRLRSPSPLPLSAIPSEEPTPAGSPRASTPSTPPTPPPEDGHDSSFSTCSTPIPHPYNNAAPFTPTHTAHGTPMSSAERLNRQSADGRHHTPSFEHLHNARQRIASPSPIPPPPPLPSALPAAARRPSPHRRSVKEPVRASRFSLSAVSSALRAASTDVVDRIARGRSQSTAPEESRGRARDHSSFGRGGAGSRSRDPPPVRLRDESVGGERGQSRGRHTGRKALTSGAPDGLPERREEGMTRKTVWREFRKGTYTYPLHFSIPSNSPPTLHCDFGSVKYIIRATVYRAGTLTPNLTAETEAILISCPGEDDMEESENVIVERQWEEQLRYLIALSGKSFPVGGQIPFSLTLMPLSKCKLHRLSAVLEEKVDYFAHERKVARHEATRVYLLLKVSYKPPTSSTEPTNSTPLLPLLSDSADVALASPLAKYVVTPSADRELSDVAAALLNPTGPWELQGELQLPNSQGSKLQFSVKHAKSEVVVAHWLKIIMRVERGDDEALDTKGKRRLFDIIVDTPINILSEYCITNWTSLPTYSFAPSPPPTTPSGRPADGQSALGSLISRGPRLSSPSFIRMPTSSSFNSTSSSNSATTPPLATPTPSAAYFAAASAMPDGTAIEDSPLDRNIHYALLTEGALGPSGEVPPSYDEAVRISERAVSNSRSRSRAPGSEPQRRGSRALDMPGIETERGRGRIMVPWESRLASMSRPRHASVSVERGPSVAATTAGA